MTTAISIFWFRRDLRIEDNAALFYALKDPHPVQPIFIFDSDILETLKNKKNPRVEFIHRELSRLASEFQTKGTALDIRIGRPIDVWQQLLDDYDIAAVYANRDYEPYARSRDKAVYELLRDRGISFKAKKDHVIFEKDEIVKRDGKPYTVYTPYSKIWKTSLDDFYIKAYPSESIDNWHPHQARPVPSLTQLGFDTSGVQFPARQLDIDIAENYHNTRDIPAIRGTSRLSVHLRFGSISIRNLVRYAIELNEKYLNELIWRDFYQAILWHFPQVAHNNFSAKYDAIEWRNDGAEFDQWCSGNTGYPIVDAGMRELNTTGFMHNRVRMIVASFLTKHLLIDWRWGEAYFAEKLLDYELASNNGGWQWAAGTGVDAAPYFRIFNPYTQTQKFDPNFDYIRQWLPEFDTAAYVKPIVNHKYARERCLATYKKGLQSPAPTVDPIR